MDELNLRICSLFTCCHFDMSRVPTCMTPGANSAALALFVQIRLSKKPWLISGHAMLLAPGYLRLLPLWMSRPRFTGGSLDLETLLLIEGACFGSRYCTLFVGSLNFPKSGLICDAIPLETPLRRVSAISAQPLSTSSGTYFCRQ